MERAEIVSGRWLVKAILATFVLAVIALYFTVCLLFYQGQWQFVFFPPSGAAHRRDLAIDPFAGSWMRRTAPSRSAAPATAASVVASSGLPIRDHPFDTTEEGIAQLDGWWIPAAKSDGSGAQASSLASMVLLFCPDGRSDLPQNVAAFAAFHEMGISVFAFDYRGFGKSQAVHPSQQKAYEDGAAAMQYLIGTRHIDPSHIVLYGAHVGAAVAIHTAQQFPRIAGLILENPQPSLAKEVKREQHIHVLPMWLVFSDRFDVSGIVPSLKMPKLIIATPAEPEYESGAAAVYAEATGTKKDIRVSARNVRSIYSNPAWLQGVSGFLNSLAR